MILKKGKELSHYIINITQSVEYETADNIQYKNQNNKHTTKHSLSSTLANAHANRYSLD